MGSSRGRLKSESHPKKHLSPKAMTSPSPRSNAMFSIFQRPSLVKSQICSTLPARRRRKQFQAGIPHSLPNQHHLPAVKFNSHWTVTPYHMRCSRATKRWRGCEGLGHFCFEYYPNHSYRHYLFTGQIVHLTPGVRKETHFKESEYAGIQDLRSIRWKLRKRESLNKNFVPVETYPELKCKNRRIG
jgi:hypothetical protein